MSSPRPTIRLRHLVAAMALLPALGFAQPAGNPKGSTSPMPDDAGKVSASRNAAQGTDASPPSAVTGQQSRMARSGNDRTAGMGSTGGLGKDVAPKGTSTGGGAAGSSTGAAKP